jgi:hypothetical protein
MIDALLMHALASFPGPYQHGTARHGALSIGSVFAAYAVGFGESTT